MTSTPKLWVMLGMSEMVPAFALQHFSMGLTSGPDKPVLRARALVVFRKCFCLLST